jgi:hypothetical protein
MYTKKVAISTTVQATTAVEPMLLCGFGGTYPAAGAAALGVFADNAETGDDVAVDLGVIPVESGGAIAAGAEVQAGTNGKVITKAAGVTVGRAIDTATADGDIIRIKIFG